MLRRLIATVSLAAGVLSGCAHSPRPTDALFPDPFTPMGHRGARGLAPENTLAAFNVALAHQMGFELDTTLCATGQLVVIHDDTLDRTTTGVGPVAEAPLSSIVTLDAGSHFHPSFAGERVPTLDAVLQVYGRRALVNIEVKAGKGADSAALAQAVVDLVEAHDLVHAVIVTSFSPFVLEEVRKRNDAIARGQIFGTFAGADLAWYEKALLRNLAFNRRARPDLLMVEHVLATPEWVERRHAQGYRVFVWTVNDPEDMRRLITVSRVDGIITDRPDILRRVMVEVAE